jgi:hypothetical protein
MKVKNNYVCRKTGKDDNGRIVYRDWFLVKNSFAINSNTGVVKLDLVHFPIDMIGKRIRFKIEVIE